MEISQYFSNFEEANKAQDHHKMMSVMQKFFNTIHAAEHEELLSYYSMASQFELFGMSADPIKHAVIARVKSMYSKNTNSFDTWKNTARGLNSLLETDGKIALKIEIRD